MDFKKLLVIAFVLTIFSASAFATAPVVTPLTLTPAYTNDLNYMKFSLNFYTTASGDVNEDSMCWYRVSTGGTTFIGDWNSDTNRCSITGYTSAGTDDFNFSMIVTNGAKDANGTTPISYYWLDETAPVTVGTHTSTSVTLNATDSATTTGDGSGVKRIYYKLDSGAWAYTTNSTLTLTPSFGAHHLYFYSVDNLDNNEWVSNGGFWDKPFNTEGIPDCGLYVWLAPLLGMLLALFVIMQLMTGKFSVSMVSMCVAGVIGIVIVWAFSASICVL